MIIAGEAAYQRPAWPPLLSTANRQVNTITEQPDPNHESGIDKADFLYQSLIHHNCCASSANFNSPSNLLPSESYGNSIPS